MQKRGKPFQKGQRRLPNAGRKKGTPNKATWDVQAAAEKYGCNPFEFLAQAVNGDLPYNVCRGVGKTKYMDKKGRLLMRTCESCYGTLREKLSPDTRVRAASELAAYIAPKRKAIEHSFDPAQQEQMEERLCKGREFMEQFLTERLKKDKGESK